jgi:hypothetical protein
LDPKTPPLFLLLCKPPLSPFSNLFLPSSSFLKSFAPFGFPFFFRFCSLLPSALPKFSPRFVPLFLKNRLSPFCLLPSLYL